MPIRYSKSYEQFHKACTAIGDLKKNKSQFMQLLQLWHMDHPLIVDDPPKEKEKEKSKKKKKSEPKACDDEDGEPSARKKVSIADSGKKAKVKKQTAKQKK